LANKAVKVQNPAAGFCPSPLTLAQIDDMKNQDKMTVKCLRCGQWHTNTADWYIWKKHRNCPNCGGELDFQPAFNEYIQHQIDRIQRINSDADQRRKT